MTMNDEKMQIYKQVAMVYFNVITCLLSENTEKQNSKLPDIRPITHSRFLTCENVPSVTISVLIE
jgi:hypothetical protein